jgi:hypothetical protein
MSATTFDPLVQPSIPIPSDCKTRNPHNRALDLLRSREVRVAEPIDAAEDVADSAQPDPLEMLMRKDSVKTAVSRFAELPTSSAASSS